MSNRENRRAERSTNRRPVSKTQIRRGNFMAALVFLIPVLLCAGLVWHAQASNLTTPANASAPASDDTQSNPASSDDVPTITQSAATAPENDATPPPPAKPKNETYLELDMSQGKGLFTAWRIEPSNKIALTNTNQFKQACDLRRGDVIHMSQNLMGLVTKAEKYVDPHPDADNKPDADGNVAERVIGWAKHVTDTLLYLHTTNEVVGTTPEHPFFVHGKGWVKAGALQQGDQIETETADKLVTVVSTEVVHKRQAVYNLDVEKTHTFFVGKDKLLVHNGDCVPELENAFKGPVSERQFVVDPHGNTIPVEPGEQLRGSPNGDFMQVKDANGDPTGLRIDGPHNPLRHPDPRAQMPHGHVPGITNPDGTPWLPINQ